MLQFYLILIMVLNMDVRLFRIPNSRAYVGVLYFVPNIVGTLLINLLPWSNKVGLLVGVWLSGKISILSLGHSCLT